MPNSGDHLEAVLDGFGKFLADKDVVPSKQRPYLVRWVRDFLLRATVKPARAAVDFGAADCKIAFDRFGVTVTTARPEGDRR